MPITPAGFSLKEASRESAVSQDTPTTLLRRRRILFCLLIISILPYLNYVLVLLLACVMEGHFLKRKHCLMI